MDQIIIRLSATLLPADWVIIAYLGLTSVLIVFRRKNLVRWYLYLLAHITLIFAILWLSLTSESLPLLFRFLREWYPLATIPAFYWGVSPLTQMIRRGYFDDAVIRWENRLFKGQPSMFLSKHLPMMALSEVLHLCYFSYYAIVLSLPAVLYFQGRIGAFREVVFAECLAFNVCLICYIFLPVAGPRYVFEKIGGRLAKGFLHRLTHIILSMGSSKGTAFPSSHSAIAVVVLLYAMRYDTLAFIILCPFCVGLVIGTVYGRFHYAVDTIAGTVLAGIIYGIAAALYRLLS
ncbi:MAG: phosphatase PAP2 family protein [Candidatus Poribacteria bacterium]|nr:phosphatase PAP2 family protein [Candidatus Poribacteria bacterium]